MSDPMTDRLNDIDADFSNGSPDDAARLADTTRRTTVAGGLEKAAQRVQAGGERVGNIAAVAADKLDATARYVRDHEPRDMWADLQTLTTKHPGKSLIAVAALGFIAGRALRMR
ncbi:MAG: hypothetical protein ACT4OZ_07765 [Gemmatimonadota bacterium]